MINKAVKNIKFIICLFCLILSFFVKLNFIYAANVGDVYSFDYNGTDEIEPSPQMFVVPETATYKLEVWGAQGGGELGGYGSYSRGSVFLKKGEIIYIVVGEQGKRNAGGYNGGGSGQYHAGGVHPAGYGGGGATHIAKENGLLSELSEYITPYDETRKTSDSDTILIVAGGGGGKAEDSHWGGNAGGIQGNNSTGGSYKGTGGTQSGPGARGDTDCVMAGFGYGGQAPNGSTKSSTWGAGGGGAGFYGGGAGSYSGGKNNDASGAGGSGYIGSHLLKDKVMYCYSCTISNDPETYTISNTKVDANPVSETSKIGNGYAKITIEYIYDTNSKLDRLEIDKGTFSQSFNPDNLNHTIILGSEDFRVNVNGVPQSNLATVVGNGVFDFKVGTTNVPIAVTAESGENTIYNFDFVRTPSSYRYLSDIKINGTTISDFAPEKLNYNITVGYEYDELDLEAIYGRPSQSIYTPSDLKLKTGNNTFEIVVVSEDGTYTTTYKLNVFRNHSSLLKELSFDGFVVDFEPTTLTYTLNIMSSTISVKVNAIPFDDEATVKISGFGYIKTSGTGTITVTEPNSPKTVYTINIAKEASVEPQTFEFPYTGTIQEFEAPTTGFYRLETWGAQGGYGIADGRAKGRGGFGGYSTGVVKLTKGQKLYVVVGQKGYDAIVRSDVGRSYNGGGGATWDRNDNEAAGGGGGATHISTVSDILANLSDNRESILIVAGGGGGGNYAQYGGSGGGITGMPGQNSSGTGGNQTSGYAFGLGQDGVGVGYSNGVSGGGGGYYGGLIDGHTKIDRNAGGGGSGYIGNENLISYRDITKVMYGYSVTTSEDEDTYTINTSKYSATPTSYYAKSGAGYAKISLLPQPSENNLLSSLTVKTTDYSTKLTTVKDYNPEFDMETEDYYLTVESTETTVNLSARLEDSRSTIEGLGEFEVLAGDNLYEIVVTAEAGNKKTYRVHITRPADTNPYPNDIIISGLVPSLCSKDTTLYCNVDPATFDKDTHTYYLTVPSRIKQLWFDVEKGHPYQVVNGEGKISLKGGLNDITITITSESGSLDGTNEPNSVYHYIVTRDMTGNNDLGIFDILDPEYDINYEPDTLEYYMIVPNEYDKWQVNPTDEKDTNVTNVLQMFFEVDDIDIDTHVPNATFIVTGPVDASNNNILNTGMNNITITVTAANGEVKNYILHVYREQSKNTYISSIVVKHDTDTYPLSPEFNKGNTGVYQVRVPNEVDNVDIIATPEVSTTSIKVTTNGIQCTGATCNNLLNTGNNKVILTSTAENSGVIEIYTMNIYREKNNNTNLLSLKAFVDSTELTLDPNNNPFDSSILEYTTSVGVGVTEVEIVAVPEKSTTQIKYLDGKNLKAGTNVKRVMTIAEDGTSKIYKITIERPYDDNNYLKDLTISSGTLNPNNNPFDKTVENYTVEVENDVTNITVYGEKENILSTVKGNGRYSLAVGENEIIITVTAEDGTPRDYVLKVTRKPNSNPYLANVKTTEGTITMNHTDTDYVIEVGANVNKVTLTPNPEVKTTTVTPNNAVVETPTYGDYDVTFTTLAEDGIATITYKVVLRKLKSSNNYATSIIMEEGAIKPTFVKTTETGYTAKVARSVESGTFHVTLEDPRSTYIISGNENFQIGDNTVTITVKAEDGSTRDYVINVIRQELTSNYLLGIKVKGLVSNTNYDLNPLNIPFDKTVQYYEVNVPYSESKVNISATQEDDDAEMTGEGNYNLNVGDNLIVLEITSLDGKSRTYQIKINRKASPDARLKDVVLDGSIMNPSFDKDTFTYDVSTTDTSLNFKNIIPIEQDATYEIIGNSFTTNETHQVIIRVTAPDGETKQDYTFNVTKSANDNNNLDDLRVVDFAIQPTYQKNKTLYTLTVPKDINSIVIEAIPEHPLATVFGDGYQSLTVGENQLVVEVTSESGKTKSYIIIVTREGDDNKELDNIVVKNGVMTPTFDGREVYDVVVPYEETALDLEVTLGADTQTYVVEGNTLEVGNSNIVKVIVTAENGDKKTYTLRVTREEVVSALLKNLKFEDYELVPSFNGNITTYDLTIDNEVNDFIDKKDFTSADAADIAKKYLLVETLDKNATYTITGNTGLVEGSNVITITVTSSDNVTNETYTVNVNKQAYSNSFLDYLYTNYGDVTPTFNRYTMEYTIEVPNSMETIEFYGEPVDHSATVVGACDPASSDLSTCTHNLLVGQNKIPITVTTTSNVKRTYYVTVTRKASDENLLETLIVKVNGEIKELTPVFNKLTNNYTLEVPIGTEFISLSGTISPKAKVEGLGTRNLVGGTNNIDITVTSESGIPNVYNIQVIRPKSDNNHLTDLIPSVGELEPDFSYEETEYTINLDSSAAFLSFEVVLEDPNATVTGIESQVIPDGTSTREIIVTAEDGTERKYTITINKERTDIATLDQLYVIGYPFEAGTFEGVSYVATFDSDIYEYHITVPNSKKVLLPSEVVATTTDKNAKITKSSNVNLLTTKENEFIVTVTAPDGFTKQDYKIIITREKSNEALLNSLKVNIGYLTTPFNPNVFNYTWKVPKNSIITDASVTATASDPNAEIIKTTSLTISPTGPNIYEVMVVAEDGSTSVTYTLNVEIDLSVDATLASLVVDKGYYTPTFDPNTKRYDVYEYEDETGVTVTATPHSETSHVVSGNGYVPLPLDETYHKIVVEAEDGSQEEYELYIHKTIKRDEGLKDLFLNGLEDLQCIDDKCILSPSFLTNIIEYNIKVPYEYTKLDVYYEKMNDQQNVKIKVGGEYVTTYDLPLAKIPVLVEVYDGMGKLTRTYTLNVERCKSNNTYLKKLEVNGVIPDDKGKYAIYTLDPDFDKTKLEYTILVENDVDEVSIIAEPEDENAYVIKNGYNYLGEGNNDATIEVVAPDGSRRTYILHIIKAPTFNSYIKNITVSTGIFWELTPKFKPTTFEYKVTVPSYAEKATVEAVPVSPDTDISGTGEYELKVGINVVTLKSQSRQGGEPSYYRVTIIREESTNVDIDLLIVEEGDLYPSFMSSKTQYEVNVPADVEKLTLHVTLADKTSTYQVFGNDHLITGDNIVSIVVTNSTKTAAKTYQITVHKAKDNNNNLGKLKIYDDNKTYLDETFGMSNPPLQHYSINVPYDVEKVNVLATPASDKATVIGNGEEYLNFGNNYKNIIVTSENGEINAYQVNIYREYNLYLKELISDIGTLNPTFDKTIDTYTIDLDNDQDRIVFVAIPESNKVTVEGSDTYNLVTGPNVITFTVRDPDNNTKTYTVTVNRAKDDNNYLKELQITGILTPTFVKTTQEYTVDLRKEITEVTDDVLTSVIPESSTATYVVKNRTLSANLDEPSDVTITVTSESGLERDYVLHVYRRPDEFFSNRLLSLIVRAGTEIVHYNPDFNKDINNYAATVANSVTEVEIEVTKENERAVVVGDGLHTLQLGRNVIEIQVTSNDGTGEVTNIYSMIIYREESADATLKSLTVKNQNFLPIFQPNVENYTLEVDGEVDSLEITAIPTDPNANVTISGHNFLTMGMNTVTIHVTAPDGITTKDYTITVTKTASKNNFLKELEVAGYTLQPEFNKLNQGPYTVNVPNTVNSALINAVTESTKATLTGDGAHPLVTGRNVFPIDVRAESGDVRTYTVVINKAASSDSTLKDLIVSDGDLDPDFKPNILNYEVLVPEDLEDIVVTGIVNDPTATVEGNGTYDLIDAETEIKITVTAEDGNKTTYTVKVIKDIKESSKLKKLVVKDGELYPRFHKLITSYTILVPNEIRSLDMIYEPEDPDATVQVIDNERFKVGSNKVIIRVTSKNGDNTTDYEINVVRQVAASNYLMSLEVEGYTLNPVFNKNTMYYEVTVPMDVDEVKIKAILEDSTATVSGTGIKYLNPGTNLYYVTVESASGVIRSYQIVINRTQSSENKLLTLTYDVGTIDPAFDPDHNAYVITVPEKTKEITLDGTVSENSTVIGLGKSNVVAGDQTRTITVTSQSGDTNTYTVIIRRPASNNTRLIDLVPSAGTLSYDNDTLEYTMQVDDNVSVISFTATPEDDDATIIGTDLTTINYGDNEIVITVTAEDGVTTRQIKIKVVKSKDLISIISSETDVTLSEGEDVVITYTLDPADTSYPDVTWVSKDSTIATVDQTGKITGVAIGTTQVQIISDHDNTIYATINVNVINKRIVLTDTSTYSITRKADETDTETIEHVIGLEPSTKLSDFLTNFKNNPLTLHVYDKNGNEIMNPNSNIATFMTIKLIIDNVVYDELTIVVRGDLNGDSYITVTDLVKLQNSLLSKVTLDYIESAAAEMSGDGYVTVTDLVKLQNYLLNKISSVN